MKKQPLKPSQMSVDERLYEISKIIANAILVQRKDENTCLYDQ